MQRERNLQIIGDEWQIQVYRTMIIPKKRVISCSLITPGNYGI